MRRLVNCYEDIVSSENLWLAWRLFRRGKRHRRDVRLFERYLEDQLLLLQDELRTRTYTHGTYRSFTVHDPKRRTINAPCIRDQVVHRAVWNVLFPFFDRRFSPSVFSCRPGRGTHAAVRRIQRIDRYLRGQIFVLHLDIVKYFDSVDHNRLQSILQTWITCERTLHLLELILKSHESGFHPDGDDLRIRRGIPLGNLTSQLFCNVMLMPFDRFVSTTFCHDAYVRYADDCFFLNTDRESLASLALECQAALQRLDLACRWRIARYHGFEGLGKRFFMDGVGLRRNTRRRATRKLAQVASSYAHRETPAGCLNASLQSFIGLTSPVKDCRWTKSLRKGILELL